METGKPEQAAGSAGQAAGTTESPRPGAPVAAQAAAGASAATATSARKGPFSFLSGSLTSLLLAWLFLKLAQRLVAHYLIHPPHYASPVAQSIAVAVKTLVVGMGFLATFTCGFVGLGLFLVFLRSLLPAPPAEGA
jgi:hypothetical protein